MPMQESDEAGCITVDEAASELLTTSTRVLMLIKERSLEGELSNGCWSVTRASLERFSRSCVTLTPERSCRTGCSSAVCGCG